MVTNSTIRNRLNQIIRNQRRMFGIQGGAEQKTLSRDAHKYRLLHAQRFLDALEQYTQMDPEPEDEDSPEHAAWEHRAAMAVTGAFGVGQQ
jgi:hypothetical protein